MKAEVVTITKELANYYLSKNIDNRKVKRSTLEFYKSQMAQGKWKENGEPIIIDKNGIIKDGQHRLLAVKATGHMFKIPIITGVEPDVMDTIDTGTNRSAGDVLELNGFNDSVLMASLSKLILNGKISTRSSHHAKISNADILNFAKSKKEYLEKICNEARKINALELIKVLSPSYCGYYLYKYGCNQQTIDFLKMITGTLREPNTATDYVFQKLAKAKEGKERLSSEDKIQYIEKAYEYFLKGNPKVRFVRINNQLNK